MRLAKNPSLPSNDVIVAPDGSKGQDWEEKLLKTLNPMKLDLTNRYTMYSQESLEKRLDRVHGNHTLEQIETILLLSPEPPSFKVGPRKLNPKANTRGNVIGPLETPDWHDKDVTWTIPWSDKKEMYSTENLPLPGGSCKVEHNTSKATKGSDLVPAFWHEGPQALATELAHLLQATAIIDLTPGSGHWAMYSVRKQIPYLGCCFTSAHIDMLYSKLRSKILSAAMDANDADLYDPNLSTLVASCRKPSTATSYSGSGPETSASGADRQSLLSRIAALRSPAQPGSTQDIIEEDES